jgi:hypothetical protein
LEDPAFKRAYALLSTRAGKIFGYEIPDPGQ